MRSNAPEIRNYRNCNKCTFLVLMMATLLVVLFSGGCVSTQDKKDQTENSALSDVERQFGIKIERISITAVGHFVDFRYRVIDPEKAMGLRKRGDEAYVIDQASGLQFPVPVTKVGPLRGTGTMPKAGRIYTIMFTSGGKVIREGSLVTIVIGEFKAENLVVE